MSSLEKESAPSQGKGRPSKTTVLLRAFFASIIVLSCLDAFLTAIGMGVDQVVRLGIDENIIFYPPGGGAPIVLFSQIDATIGLRTTCVSYNCFDRSEMEGVFSMVPSNESQLSKAGASPKLVAAYNDLRSQFTFGYDIGEECGRSSGSESSMSVASYSAAVLTLVFAVVIFAVASTANIMVSHMDVLSGVAVLNVEEKLVVVGRLKVGAHFVLEQIEQCLKYERPLLIMVLVGSFLCVIWSGCAMGGSVSLLADQMKCGTSVCNSLASAAREFTQIAAEEHINIVYPSEFFCHNGITVPFYIVAFVISFCIFALSLIIGYLYYRFDRIEKLRERRDRLCDLFITLGRHEEVDQLVRSRSKAVPVVTTDNDWYGFLRPTRSISIAYDPADRLSHGAGAREASSFGFSSQQGRVVSSGAVGSEGGGAVAPVIGNVRTVGGAMRLHRFVSSLQLAEARHRQEVEKLEATLRYSFRIFDMCLWFDGELSYFHRFTLEWYMGPFLDLHVMETMRRQAIMAAYVEELSLSVEKLRSPPEDSHRRWNKDEVKELKNFAKVFKVSVEESLPNLHACASHYPSESAASRKYTESASATLSNNLLGQFERLRGPSIFLNDAELATPSDDIFSDPSGSFTLALSFALTETDKIRNAMLGMDWRGRSTTEFVPSPPPRLYMVPVKATPSKHRKLLPRRKQPEMSLALDDASPSREQPGVPEEVVCHAEVKAYEEPMPSPLFRPNHSTDMRAASLSSSSGKMKNYSLSPPVRPSTPLLPTQTALSSQASIEHGSNAEEPSVF